jgi:hypothetical protein
MKIKIKQTKPKARAKKSPGWHALSLEELVHWAHAWEVQQRSLDKLFHEKETVTALQFGCDRSTISRRNAALVEARVAKTLHEGERDKKTQWFVESSLCVTEAPPASVLRLAQSAREVREMKSPCATLHTAQGCVNSGSEPCAELHDITTTHIPLNSKSVSTGVVHIGTVDSSNGVRANMHTAQGCVNSGDEPCATLHTDTKTIKRQLRDAENKLLRLWREYGKDEPISRVQSDRVAELKANLAALGDVQ